MINLTNITIINDGSKKRLAYTWEEIDEDGKTISTNNHASRIITDNTILKKVTSIEEYLNKIIEEV